MEKLARTLVGVLATGALVAAPAQASWTVAPGTVPSNTSGLGGVECVTASSCVLVGAQSGVGTRALAADWNGSAFGAQTMASTTSDLYDTACGSTLCFAVGIDYASGTAPHAEKYDGTSWSTTSTPTPTGATYVEMLGVSCASTTCAAVGWYQTSTANLPYAELWNGTSWSLQTLSLPGNLSNAKLLDVSCPSTSSCTAVGYIEATGAPRRTLVVTWNGTSWSTQTSANPSGATLSQLLGVECASSSQCTAVGQYLDGSSVQHALAEEWTGSSWSLHSVPDPSGGSAPVLNDVSCVSSPSYACEAVGNYTSSTPNVEPMAAGWNGSTWSLQAVPKASGVSDATLTGVSCPTTCMAVGVSLYDGSIGITGPRPAVELGP